MRKDICGKPTLHGEERRFGYRNDPTTTAPLAYLERSVRDPSFSQLVRANSDNQRQSVPQDDELRVLPVDLAAGRNQLGREHSAQPFQESSSRVPVAGRDEEARQPSTLRGSGYLVTGAAAGDIAGLSRFGQTLVQSGSYSPANHNLAAAP